jgi:hypothetical protein
MKALQNNSNLKPWYNFNLSSKICQITPEFDENESREEQMEQFRKKLREYEIQEQMKEWSHDDDFFVQRIKMDKYLKE